jgi:hypothetical protein
VVKTSDRGQTWTKLISGTTEVLFGVDCLRTTICLAAGSFGTVLVTVDGSTWIQEQLPTANVMLAVAFWDPGSVWVVGEGGSIFANRQLLNLCDSVNSGIPTLATQGDYVGFIGSANGCTDPEFKWFLQAPGGSWVAKTGWVGMMTGWVWQTTNLTPPGVYGVGVWARQRGSTAKYETYFLGTLTLLSSRCTSVGIELQPNQIGTQATFAVGRTGCPGPYYRYWVLPPGGSWTTKVLRTTSEMFTWDTAGLASGTYQVGVWATENGPTSAHDAYAITTYALGTGNCISAGMSPDLESPQPPSPTVTFTATSNSCTSPQYEFRLQSPGGAWTVKQPLSNTATWSWNTAGLKPGLYEYGVWVKQAGSVAPYDAYFIGTYQLLPVRCNAVIIATSPTSPAAPGESITLSASVPSLQSPGCSDPRYQFWVLAPGATAWRVIRPYAAGATFDWDTTGLAPGPYRLGVWARQNGSLSSYETYAQSTFWIGT